MKRSSFLFALISFMVFSCGNNSINNHKTITDQISRVKGSDFEIFTGVTLEARNTKDGVFKSPFLQKQLDGITYLLPNFLYYNCDNLNAEECLKAKTTHDFDIIDFGKIHNKYNSLEAYEFSKSHTKNIFKEFEKYNILGVLSKSSIGNCIIFNLSDKVSLAYVPEVTEIHNEYWKARFTENNLISKNWYLVNK